MDREREHVDLDSIELDPEFQEFIDSLEEASKRLKKGGGDPLEPFKRQPRKPLPVWLRSFQRITLFYVGCLAVGIILSSGELLIMHLTGYLR